MTTIDGFILNEKFECLTPREKQVVACFLRHMTIHETAEYLHRSPKTIEKHRANIMLKLQIKRFRQVFEIYNQ